MSYVQKRNGRYRARYRDPLGRMTSTTFDHKLLAGSETGQSRTGPHSRTDQSLRGAPIAVR